jgi:hypothetical protein
MPTDAYPCLACYHTDLADVFSRIPLPLRREVSRLNKIAVFDWKSRQHHQHLFLQSNKPLCNASWNNKHDGPVITEGFFNAEGIQVTTDVAAARCVLNILEPLAQYTKWSMVFHGSFVIHEYMRQHGMDPGFTYKDLDIILLGHSSLNFRNKVYRYAHTAAGDQLSLDIMRSTARTWEDVLPSFDLSIGELFLKYSQNDLVEAERYGSTNWWFVGTPEAKTDILARRATYYRDDEYKYAAKSLQRRRKYVDRGFDISDVYKARDASHLDLYYCEKSSV